MASHRVATDCKCIARVIRYFSYIPGFNFPLPTVETAPDPRKLKKDSRCSCCSWSALLVRFPYLFVLLVFLVVGLCVLGLWLDGTGFPSFDPLLGFESRGTRMGKAIVTKNSLQLNNCNLTVVVPPSAKRRSRRGGCPGTAAYNFNKLSVNDPLWIYKSNNKKSLWSLPAIKAMCQLDSEITTKYPEMGGSNYFRFHSLGKQLVSLVSPRAEISCQQLTPKYLDQGLSILQNCSKANETGTLKKCCKNNDCEECSHLPHECRNCIAFEMLYYLLDRNFDASDPFLEYAMSVSARR
jgi:hypothetical protein